MLYKPNRAAGDLKVVVHSTIPEGWPRNVGENGVVGHVFQTRPFLDAWTRSFGGNRAYEPLYVEVLAGGGARIALLPLAIERKGRLRTLSFLDQGQADYNAALLMPEAEARLEAFTPEFWSELLAVLPPVDLLRLDKVPARLGEWDNPLLTLTTARHAESAHGNDLTLPIEKIEATLLSPKEVRSKQRALEKIAPVRFLVAEDDATRRSLLEALILQKQRRFEETRVPGFDDNPESLAFLRAADEAFAQNGNAYIAAIMVGDEPVAIQWGLIEGKRLYALVTGFAAGQWIKFSTGRILNLRLLQWAKEQGFTYLDQGYGDEPYKLRGTDTNVELFEIVEARSGRGRRHLAWQATLTRLRASPLWAKLRPLKWVVLRALRGGKAG